MKNGQPIKFSIEDPSSYTDYATDAQLITEQLNSEGFEVSFGGVQATQWYGDVAAGNFQAILRWSNQGPTPWDYFDLWMDHNLSAPIGKPAGDTTVPVTWAGGNHLGRVMAAHQGRGQACSQNRDDRRRGIIKLTTRGAPTWVRAADSLAGHR